MLSSLWAWLRRHPRVVDSVYAALFLLPNGPYVYSDVYPMAQSMGSRPVAVAFIVLMCVPLVWRRRYPLGVFAVLAAVAFFQWAANHYLTVADTTLLLAAYTVAAHCRRVYTILAFLTLELGCLLVMLRWVSGWDSRFAGFLALTAFVLAAMLFGDSVRSRRAYYVELEARAERLEREREREAALAVADERARIAREMHDVVAHNVSVMVVQAEGAAYLMDTDPGRSKTAVQTVAGTGRQALAEMRRLLGVLRSGDGTHDPLAPQPGLADLDDLVARVEAAGLPVELEMADGTVAAAPGQGLAAYRVVQEALTNVLKHGGPKAQAWVAVERDRDVVRLTVTDDGRGAAADVSEGPGHGLRGMRERVGVYGGTLRAGPRPGGGYEVHAEIPAGQG